MESLPGEEDDGGEDEEDVPEPEDQVDLLIDYVDGESAEARGWHHVPRHSKVGHLTGHN